ncbi:hypothetical protein T492DRAFT_939115, partial [Pavlovales sp. CCMP2436]
LLRDTRDIYAFRSDFLRPVFESQAVRMANLDRLGEAERARVANLVAVEVERGQRLARREEGAHEPGTLQHLHDRARQRAHERVRMDLPDRARQRQPRKRRASERLEARGHQRRTVFHLDGCFERGHKVASAHRRVEQLGTEQLGTGCLPLHVLPLHVLQDVVVVELHGRLDVRERKPRSLACCTSASYVCSSECDHACERNEHLGLALLPTREELQERDAELGAEPRE